MSAGNGGGPSAKVAAIRAAWRAGTMKAEDSAPLAKAEYFAPIRAASEALSTPRPRPRRPAAPPKVGEA